MKWFRRFYCGLILLFLYAPIAVLILFSFNEGKSRSEFTGFSLQWYEKLFEDEMLLESLFNTLLLAACSALIATVIGTYAALAISRMPKVAKKLSMTVLNIPMLNAEIVTGISLMMLFVFFSVPLGFVSLLIAHVMFNVPYVVLSILPKLRQMNQGTYEAALDLGATPARAFRTVILPQILPGVISGAIMAFTLSLDDFIISYFTSGPTFPILSVTINTMTKRAMPLTINALSALMFIVVFVLLLIVNLKPNGRKKNV